MKLDEIPPRRSKPLSVQRMTLRSNEFKGARAVWSSLMKNTFSYSQSKQKKKRDHLKGEKTHIVVILKRFIKAEVAVWWRRGPDACFLWALMMLMAGNLVKPLTHSSSTAPHARQTNTGQPPKMTRGKGPREQNPALQSRVLLDF